MKGQLPIVIAFVIVMAIVISTAIYISTIPVNVNFSYTGKQYSDWEIYDQELTQLLLYMLKQGVSTASPLIEDYIRSNVFTQSISYTRVYAPLTAYLSYSFFWPSRYFHVYVPVGEEYSSITPSYYTGTILSEISSLATQTLNTTAYKILTNWVKSIEKLGLRITIDKFVSAYNLSLTTTGTTAIGVANASINFTITIFNTLGEYRVYTKTSLLHCQVNFTHGYYSGADSVSGGFVLPIVVHTYIMIDGTRFYYVLAPQDINTYYYSPLFSILPSFATEYHGEQLVKAYVINGGQAAFYRGNGLTNMTLIIRYNTYDNFLVDWIKYIHFSSVIGLIKSTDLDWNNVFYVFNDMVWHLYQGNVNITVTRIVPDTINITNNTGNNVLVYISYNIISIPFIYYHYYVNYTKTLIFYVPGYSKIDIDGTPVIVPTQFYVYYRGEYIGEYNYTIPVINYTSTLNFDINITGG